MPKIPGLESQVDTQALRPVTRSESYDANDFGGSLGQSMQGFGGQVAQLGNQIAKKKKDDADAIAVMEADRRLSEWENRNLYDAKTGAYNVLGKESMALPDRLIPDLDKNISELEAGLANDEQKLKFRALSSTRRLDVDRGLETHIAKQILLYQEKESAAYVENSIEAAAANYENPERIATEIDRIEMAYQARATITGESADVTKSLTTEATSKAHVAVINRMLGQGRYSWAKEYLKANKDDISATVVDEVDKAVRVGTVREESQSNATTIMASAEDRSAALAAARKVSDPEVQDATVNEINQRYNEINQAREENKRNRINSATQVITNGGTVNDIPPAQWNQFSKEERAGLHDLQNRGEWYQNWKKWAEFSNLMDSDPDSIAKMNLYSTLRPYTDDVHFDAALKMKKSILDSKKGKSSDYDHTIDFKKRLKNSLVENGVFDADLLGGSKGTSDSEKERYARIESEASVALANFNENKGRKATPQEMEKIIDDITMRKVYVNEFGRDPTKLSIEIQEDEAGNVYVPVKNIPKAETIELRNLAASYGRAVTDDKLERAYAAALMGDADAMRAIMAE